MTVFPGSARIVRCDGNSRGGETFPETMATNGTRADLAGGHDARPRDPEQVSGDRLTFESA